MSDPLSLTGKRWNFRSTGVATEGGDPKEFVRMLFESRNLTDDGEGSSSVNAWNVLETTEGRRAVDRVLQATVRTERIGIFGDYDCDGITSAALLTRFFRRRGTEPLVILPKRSEGYGLSAAHIDLFLAEGVTLLLTVDTGITAHGPISDAKAQGMDVIVLDHHQTPETLPPAYSILHPALASECLEPYPCAAGVTFAFVTALERAGNRVTWQGAEEDLALAAIGTVADLVELRGKNRLLVQRGLAALNVIHQGPLAELVSLVRPNGEKLRSSDIGFRIAPRINAAGRMADPVTALSALLGDRNALAELSTLNTHRQHETETLLAHALERIDLKGKPFLCIAHEKFSPGIVGLIAGKLTELSGKPSLVASIVNGECRASLRSIPGYNITEALHGARELLTSYGGHAAAAGCAFPHAHFSVLEARLCAHLLERIPFEHLRPTVSIDAALDPRQISLELCEALDTLEPYGQGNPEPRFLLQGVVLERPRTVGANALHLQGQLRGIPMIGFGLAAHMHAASSPLDLVCRIGRNTWNGRTTAQIMAEDLRSSQLIAVS